MPRKEPPHPVLLPSPKLGSGLRLWHIAVLGLTVIAASVVYSGGGFAQTEIRHYLPYHLNSDRPFWNRIFDSKALDQGMYQARELSYILDELDCLVIGLSVRAGLPHLLSFVHYSFVIIIGLLIWWFAVHRKCADPLLATGAVLLWWTTPAVFLWGNYFRSAKIGVALASVVGIILLDGLLSGKRTWAAWGGFTLTLVAATLLDRQGVFLEGTLAAAMLIRRKWRILALVCCVLLFSVYYDLVFGPQATEFLNGYSPSLFYQRLPWDEFFSRPVFFMTNGALLVIDAARFTCGNVPQWCTIAGAGVLMFVLLRRRKWEVPLIAVFLCGMHTLMFLRYQMIALPDLRRIYYPLPTCALVVVAIVLLAPKRRMYGTIALGLVLTNMASLPYHRSILAAGCMKDQIVYSRSLLSALRGGMPTAEVAEDPIFHLFFPDRAR